MNKMPTVHSSEYLCGKEKTGLSFSVKFVNYCESDYDAVCDFLIEMNRNNDLHINWNWARFEWMYEHSGFDKSLISNSNFPHQNTAKSRIKSREIKKKE